MTNRHDQTRPALLGLGEVLWDCFPDQRRPGGAPANVAYHATQLGLRGAVASRVGVDPLGAELRDFLHTRGLDTRFVQQDTDHPTGRVEVTLTAGGHARYIIHEDVAWDHIAATDELLSAAGQAAAVCYGTLARRHDVSRVAIARVLAATPAPCWRIFDINLRQPYFNGELLDEGLRYARALKLNDAEVPLLADLLDLHAGSLADFAADVQTRYDVEVVCVTRGAAGCFIAARDEISEAAGEPVIVVDTVGAGDAFTAGLAFGLVHNWPLSAITGFANRVGGLVASRAGAMPDVRDAVPELLTRFAP